MSETKSRQLLMGYRASMQATTEYSPFFLLHGWEMVSPVHKLHRLRAPEADSIDLIAETLVKNLQNAWDNALVNISRKQAKMQCLYAEKQLHGQDPKATNKVPMLATDPTTPGAAETAALPSSAATPTTVSKTPTRASLQPIGNKRGAPDASVVQLRDFVLVKVHGWSTTDKATGKLAANLEVDGPYYLPSFPDDTQTVANIEGAEGTAWKRKTSDLSKYTGNA